jgi:hypothetical protein
MPRVAHRFRGPTGLIALSLLSFAAVASAAPAVAKRAPARPGVDYVFYGRVAAEPGAGATALQVQITGGSWRALRALIGATEPVTFRVDASTHWIVWSALQDGRPAIPGVGSSGGVHPGDPVAVTIHGRRNASLSTLLSTPARRVGDWAAATPRPGRLYLFQGSAVAVDRAARTVTIDVRFGNWRALYAMLGQPIRETFHYDRDSVFLHWEHGIPNLLRPADIAPGDVLTLRLRAPAGTALPTLASVPLWRVNDHEPQALVAHDAPES